MKNVFGAAVWLVGILLAKGFWSTFFAVICPIWGLWLIIEKWVVPLI